MYDFHKIRKGNMENYFHHDKFVKGNLQMILQIKRKQEKNKLLKNNTRYRGQNEKYFSENDIMGLKKNENNINKTEITLNSVHTIKAKSQESIILMRNNVNQGLKIEPIYF